MSMADLFMDALSAIAETEREMLLDQHAKQRLTVARESVEAIAERLAPGEDGDLDCAVIVPCGDELHHDELWRRIEPIVREVEQEAESSESPRTHEW